MIKEPDLTPVKLYSLEIVYIYRYSKKCQHELKIKNKRYEVKYPSAGGKKEQRRQQVSSPATAMVTCDIRDM